MSRLDVIQRVLSDCESLSMDNESDRLSLAGQLERELSRCCPLCFQDLTGKRDRTHFAKVTDQTPCKGGYL